MESIMVIKNNNKEKLLESHAYDAIPIIPQCE